MNNLSATDVCVLSNKLSSKIAFNVNNRQGEVNYQNCFDYDFAIQEMANQYKTFIIIANFANNNELKDAQQFCIDNKINLFIISYEHFDYEQMQSKYIVHLTCDTYSQQQNMFRLLNQKLKVAMSNE